MHFSPAFDAKALLQEHRNWASQHASMLAKVERKDPIDRSPDRPLRIGILSVDLRGHAVGRFLIPLIENHDREQFEFVLFSSSTLADAVTDRFRNAAEQWHDVARLSDQAQAEMIASQRIDILIDVGLHTGQNKMLVFARKPAPIQLTWLAYAGTSGIDAIDYRLTDPFIDPPDQDDNYVEKSVRLKSYWCYQPSGTPRQIAPLPALTTGHVTFGCLNQFAKVSDEALALWKRVLDAVPDSKLLISSPQGKHRDRVTDILGESRVEFVPIASFDQYMANYDRIDIALDPIPYGGGTTTCDGLWMGVPIVTLVGKTGVGRGGASLLHQISLPELIANTPDEYVNIAANLARDLDHLSKLRAGLRERMNNSPLCDVKNFTRDFEAQLRSIWKRFCEMG